MGLVSQKSAEIVTRNLTTRSKTSLNANAIESASLLHFMCSAFALASPGMHTRGIPAMYKMKATVMKMVPPCTESMTPSGNETTVPDE